MRSAWSGLIRPYGIVVSGHLEIGLELVIESGRIEFIRPHTGVPDDFIVSAAFVNAHSHLEYRGLQGKIEAQEYWPWIREITRLKMNQCIEDVRADAIRAATENRATGVAMIGEHSDRPVAGEALKSADLEGIIYQEVITFFERERRQEKLAIVRRNMAENKRFWDGPTDLSPHAYQTVDPDTLREIAVADHRFSMHVAETTAESQFTRHGTGPIADFFRTNGVNVTPTGLSIYETLETLGLARLGAQFVHCCDVSQEEIQRMAAAQVTVAHCPRSNKALGCPPAPVREMLNAGIDVGLGLDSAASSGPIDMFAEMREALATSEARARAVTPEEVWNMATSGGAKSLGFDAVWDIAEGVETPLIKIQVPGALSIEDAIAKGTPSAVEWV